MELLTNKEQLFKGEKTHLGIGVSRVEGAADNYKFIYKTMNMEMKWE